MLKSDFLWNSWLNISTIEHDTTELIAPFCSQSTAHSIFHIVKNTQILQNPLTIDLAFHQIFAILQCAQNTELHLTETHYGILSHRHRQTDRQTDIHMYSPFPRNPHGRGSLLHCPRPQTHHCEAHCWPTPAVQSLYLSDPDHLHMSNKQIIHVQCTCNILTHFNNFTRLKTFT